MVVQPNKAIVGANAFAHESGIHQDGVLKEKLTYEIMTPESVGIPKSSLVLGKLSGRHAFRERLKDLGYRLSETDLELAFNRFKQLADKKREIFDEDIESIVVEEILQDAPPLQTGLSQCHCRKCHGSYGHGPDGGGWKTAPGGRFW